MTDEDSSGSRALDNLSDDNYESNEPGSSYIREIENMSGLLLMRRERIIAAERERGP